MSFKTTLKRAIGGTTGTARPATSARSGLAMWAAYAAAGWSLVFAVVHGYWAIGGTLGLPAGQTVSGNLALFIIDIVAIPLCVVGALLALALVKPWGRGIPRRWRLAAVWGVSTLLVLHAAPTFIEGGLTATGVLSGELAAEDRWGLFLYEPFFFAGGILFGAAAWGFTRDSRETAPRAR